MITEFKSKNDSLIKIRATEFDISGNLLKEVNFGGYDPISKTIRNYNRVLSYKKGRLVGEYNCEEFVSKDTCVVRSFSTYQYDPKTSVEKETKFEADSLIRFIKEVKKTDKMHVHKVHTWEFFPVKEPDYEKALVLTDTTYFDKQNRVIKQIRYNDRMEKPFVVKYNYSKNKYSYQIIGTARDTTITYKYRELQKKADKWNLDYKFSTDEYYKYEIEYY